MEALSFSFSFFKGVIVLQQTKKKALGTPEKLYGRVQ
jgi:hypothetical protein